MTAITTPPAELVRAFRALMNALRAEPGVFGPDVTTLNFVISGGGSAITTGSKGTVTLDFDARVLAWDILADQSGSIVVDVKRSTYAGFPTTSSIAASAKPTLSSAQKNTDSTLTGWTKTLADGDVLEFVVNSAATVQLVTVALRLRKV